jgi:hypothetical protein
MFLERKGRQKILDRIVAGIPDLLLISSTTQFLFVRVVGN